MATTARLDLSVWRNDDVYEFPLRVRGVDLTGVAMRAQIRLTPDNPNLLVNLATVTNGNAEGIRLAGVSIDNGVPVSDVRIRLNKSTRQGLPYAGELGDPAPLAWAFQIAGRTRLVGCVFVLAHTIESDAAPLNRPEGRDSCTRPRLPSGGATLTIADDDVVELVIDGADLIGAVVVRAEVAAAEAEAFALQSGNYSIVAQGASLAAQNAAGAAQAAADAAAGDSLTFFDTYAELAAAGLPNDTVARVWEDETMGGGYTEYRIEAGAPVFKIPLPRAPQRAIYASQYMPLNAQIDGSGHAIGTDITTRLQALLDAVGDAPLTLVLDGMGLWSSVRLWSNTRLEALPGGGGIQTDAANAPFIRNKHPLRGQFTDTEEQQYSRITDHDIEIVGGIYRGNLTWRAAIRGVDNELVNLVSLYAVRRATVRNAVFINPGCYSVHMALCDGFVAESCHFFLPKTADGSSPGPTGRNGDGVHITGPARNGTIRAISGRAGDDIVALTADDGPNTGPTGMFANTTFSGPYTGQGPIRGVLIDGVRCEESLYGVRLLSKSSRIDDITIRNITGTTFGIGLQITAYKEAGGEENGNFGKITVDGFKVQALDYLSGDPGNPDRPSDNRLIPISASIEELTLLNVARLPCADASKTHYPLIDFDANAIVDVMHIDVTAHDRGSFDQRYEGMIRAHSGALVRTLTINADWQRDSSVPATGSLLDWQGGAIGILRTNGIRANRCQNVFKMRGNANLSVVQLSNTFAESLSSYSIDDADYDDPGSPQAPSGLLYLAVNFDPEVNMHNCNGAPPIVGPSALTARVVSVEDERVGVALNAGAITRYLVKTNSIASLTRSGAGVYVINHLVPISLCNIDINVFDPALSVKGEFTSATQTTVRVFSGATPADPSILSVVLQRGGYVSA